MPSFAQFSQNIRNRGRQVENAGARVVRTAAKKALKSVVNATPADTGKARSNWRVGVGGKPTAVIPAYAPGRKLGTGERLNAGVAISVGNERINSLRGIASAGLKTSLYIVNNVPYIGLLNNGSSGQAPAGFIETAMMDAELSIKNFKCFTDSGYGSDEGDE